MKVALAQLGSGCDKSANLARITEVTAAAGGAGAQLVLFPEFAMYEKPVVDATFAHAAEPINGQFATSVAALAAEHRVSIAAGVVEQNRDDPNKPFNTLAVWDDYGNLVGRHRKALLFDVGSFAESRYISAGDPAEVATVAVGGTVVGLQTCYELRFPELSRAQVSAGATVLAVLSSWVPGPHKTQQWTTLSRARAIENLCHVCAVTQAARCRRDIAWRSRPTGTCSLSWTPRPTGCASRSITDIPNGRGNWTRGCLPLVKRWRDHGRVKALRASRTVPFLKCGSA